MLEDSPYLAFNYLDSDRLLVLFNLLNGSCKRHRKADRKQPLVRLIGLRIVIMRTDATGSCR